MSMNRESFDYIKSTFATQQLLLDYIKEIEYLKTNASTDDPVTGSPSYANLVRLFTKTGSEVDAEAGTSSYNGSKLPSAKKIIIPDSKDLIWISLRKKLIEKSVKAFDYSVDSVTDVHIREYLKKHFDGSLPDPKSNISIDDPVFNNAWKKYYEDIDSINSIFGSPYNGAQQVVLTFADAVISRLSTFDLSKQAPPVDTGEPPPEETNPPVDVMPDSERLEALREFLSHGGMTGPGGDSTASLILNVIERNSLLNPSKYADQTR